ncbi:Glutathione S-transferase [Pseudomonas syringae pv. philadelphi]|uniref:glutathione transferase n=1 Tax=Pseudomonas syringae pv. philadelphi TaxID=251706 RepID=A0A3M3YPS3_9PSED|nr:glutathione S-transferase family protein [Pseudomonas syringae group genomosp. 3]RMO84482.1 Glutathione S-transferase [Pseudomonas syringae pv. philadelphi]
MPHTQLTLVSHPLCPFVQRVAIVLHEKGISFEQIHVDLRDKPDWFLAISPNAKVPLLKVLHGNGPESVLFESVAICEYVEDVQPGPALHPADAILRAQHRAWIEFASATLADAWGFLNASDHETANVKVAAFRKKLERFDTEMSDGPYFGGDHFSMVDAAIAPIFRYFDILAFESNHPAFNGLKRVADWRRALAQRQSIKAAVAKDYASRFVQHLQNQKALLATNSLSSAV